MSKKRMVEMHGTVADNGLVYLRGSDVTNSIRKTVKRQRKQLDKLVGEDGMVPAKSVPQASMLIGSIETMEREADLLDAVCLDILNSDD